MQSSRRGRGRGRRRGGNRGRGRGGRGGRGGRSGGTTFNNDAKFEGELDAHPSGVTAVAVWAEQGKLFTGGADGQVRMWSADGTSEHTVPMEGPVGTLCFSAGWLFVGYLGDAGPGAKAGFVKCFNFAAPAPSPLNLAMSAQFPAAHQAKVESITVAGNPPLLFTAGLDHAIRGWSYAAPAAAGQPGSWNMAGLLPPGAQTSHDSGVTKVMSFKDRLYSGSMNGKVNVWNVPGPGNQLASIQDILGWEDATYSILLTCSLDATIKAWDLGGGRVPEATPLFTYPQQQYRVPKQVTSFMTVGMRPDRQLLIVGNHEGTIQIFDLPHFNNLGFVQGHQRNSAISALSMLHIPGSTPQIVKLYAGAMNGKLNCFTLQ